jgi:hypothetical protein
MRSRTGRAFAALSTSSIDDRLVAAGNRELAHVSELVLRGLPVGRDAQVIVLTTPRCLAHPRFAFIAGVIIMKLFGLLD